MNIDWNLNTIDWNAISSIITLIALIIALISLRQNSKQLKEMKRQWDEENRPNINISIDISQSWFVLKISNIGKQDAFNINIKFNDEFLKNIPNSRYRNSYLSLQSNPFFIEKGKSKYFMIDSCKETKNNWKDKDGTIIATGTYCNKYTINETLDINEFIIENSFKVNDELTTIMGYIKQGLIVQNNDYMPIQKSLDAIAKKITSEK
ncbi:MAG: hypothetical protein GX416_03205 [Bacteroidales bacterium]|nr:hypothetical protein [Bacteroidales bacterium]